MLAVELLRNECFNLWLMWTLNNVFLLYVKKALIFWNFECRDVELCLYIEIHGLELFVSTSCLNIALIFWNQNVGMLNSVWNKNHCLSLFTKFIPLQFVGSHVFLIVKNHGIRNSLVLIVITIAMDLFLRFVLWFNICFFLLVRNENSRNS